MGSSRIEEIYKRNRSTILEIKCVWEAVSMASNLKIRVMIGFPVYGVHQGILPDQPE